MSGPSSDITSLRTLAHALDALPEAVVLVDREWRIVYCNRLACDVMGRPTLLGLDMWSLDPHAVCDGLRDRLERLAAEGGHATFEMYGHKTGDWLLVDATTTPQGILVRFRPIDRPRGVGTYAIETLSRFWHLFETLPEGVCVVTADQVCVSVNDAMLRIIGAVDSRELLRPIDDWRAGYVLSDERGGRLPYERWPVSRALAGETIAGELIRVQRGADEGWRLCAVAATSVRDDAGKVALAIVTIRDVTEQERIRVQLQEAVESLRGSERRFAAFMDHSPVIAWLVSPDGRLIYFNQTYARVGGLDPTRDAGRHVSELFPPELAEHYLRTNLAALEAEHELEMVEDFPRADGTRGTFLSVKFAIEDQGRRVAAGLAIDITERAQLEQETRQQQERLAALVEATTDGVWEIDLTTDVVTWSDRMHELMRQPKSAPLSREFVRSLMHPDDLERHKALLDAHLSRGEPYHIDLRLRRGDGTWGTFLARGITIRDPAGRALRFLGTMQDTTHQRQAERQMQEARDVAEAANRAKDHFLAVLSHELRTPLTPVLLFSSSLERNASLPDDVRADLALIRQQVQLEARLIDDLLDLTRIQRGKMLLTLRPTHVNEVLRRVAGLAASDATANGLALVLELRAGEDIVSGDVVRLQQLFSNVVGNSIKFTPAGGSIAIRSRSGDGSVVVEVADTGIGITPEAMPRVFNAFEQAEQSITRKYGGLGLGLTIGKAITEMHGGRVTAHSNGEGRGTTIRIELPRVDEPAEPVAPQTTAPARRRVLVVEDHEATREAMERLMRNLGFDVFAADSIKSAVRIATEHEFDALVCDIGLPDGVGTDLLPQLRKVRPRFRAIALSGYGTDEDIRRSLDAGFEAHLVKPIDFAKLQETMRQITQ